MRFNLNDDSFDTYSKWRRALQPELRIAIGVIRSSENQTYWFCVSKSIPDSTTATPADPAWLHDQLRDWPDFTRDLAAATPQSKMPQVAFNDRAPTPHWGSGRVLLAGDVA
jgi:2-polyprenyl-6-methoxyphenol hydroxylase-like FAD-dependent oxidoreductase